MTNDPIMDSCLKKKCIMWGNLTDTESWELMRIFNMRNDWYKAWDGVRQTHERYGIPYNGPSAFIPDNILHRGEELSRKAWGTVNYDEDTQKLIRAANKLPGPK